MSDCPIKFPSSTSSNKDELPSHHSSKENISSDDWMLNDYSPLWSSEKDPEEEHEVDADDDANDDDDSDSNFDSPPPKQARWA
jgi:hypothetical protein